MSQRELLIALMLVAGIAGMWLLGMQWSDQQGRRGLPPAVRVVP